ncbi:hypothetical protein PIB30_005895 [Stylosanthes scabra]|uniref:Uncharacterized protein n=1 Tax=Stylosanthes scabra TaxID=79078 RepID=A0ABU6Q453_9FABA|nr:hypothetical protein [Stylosanthes scabra]
MAKKNVFGVLITLLMTGITIYSVIDEFHDGVRRPPSVLPGRRMPLNWKPRYQYVLEGSDLCTRKCEYFYGPPKDEALLMKCFGKCDELSQCVLRCETLFAGDKNTIEKCYKRRCK